MIDLLVRHFVTYPDAVNDEKTRYQYGMLAGFVCMLCNILLFLIKLTAGLLINSISIISDGFNNLSDCMSNIITLFGYRLAAKPADKEHPFGHGRMEYVVSFVTVAIMFIVTYQLFIESVQKILHPSAVVFNLPLTILLGVSVFVKLWMAHFNSTLGERIDSMVMKTVAQDSINDVLTTIGSVAAMLLSALSGLAFPFDGCAGVILSLLIAWSAFGMGRDIIAKLLGNPAEAELTRSIRSEILSHPEILGIHDMIIHEYGPGTKFGTVHAEVEASMTLVEAHDIIDEAEREILEKNHVMMTIHLDPVDQDDMLTQEYRKITEDLLGDLDTSLSIHDFRVVPGHAHANLIFDVLIPFGSSVTNTAVEECVRKGFADRSIPIHLHMTVDHGYTEEEG